jgi:uncharacterized membrane protein required for colicin V production
MDGSSVFLDGSLGTRFREFLSGLRRSRASRFLGFLYGLAAYLVFFGTILYAIGFVEGLLVPKTIDTRARTAPSCAVRIRASISAWTRA